MGRRPWTPRYLFNIVGDYQTIVDSQGVGLAAIDEARQEAVTSARELISERVLRGQAQNWRRFYRAGSAFNSRALGKLHDPLLLVTSASSSLTICAAYWLAIRMSGFVFPTAGSPRTRANV